MRKKRKLTGYCRGGTDWGDPELVERVMGHIRGGATIKDACYLEKVPHNSLYHLTSGAKPRRPELTLALRHAQAKCREICREQLKTAGLEGNQAGVKAAHHMLFCIDRRFRDDKGKASGGISVNFLVSKEPRFLEPKTLDVQVIETKTPRLPA